LNYEQRKTKTICYDQEVLFKNMNKGNTKKSPNIEKSLASGSGSHDKETHRYHASLYIRSVYIIEHDSLEALSDALEVAPWDDPGDAPGVPVAKGLGGDDHGCAPRHPEGKGEEAFEGKGEEAFEGKEEEAFD
jgi:hypothetical protein